jgi:hypothetical protein
MASIGSLAADATLRKLSRNRSGAGSNNRLLFAGSSLDKGRRIFDRMTRHRPRIRLTIRQWTSVLEQWPKATL